MKNSVILIPQSEEPLVTTKYRDCLAGFYMLSGEGKLLRFDAGGILTAEPDISDELALRFQAILRRYRSGSVNGLTLGLVSDIEADQTSGTGTMIFSDWLLSKWFDVSRSAEAPLTLLEERNKKKTVFQGMELLLNKKSKTRAPRPQFCPVLFRPEVDMATLYSRYDVEHLGSRRVFEVLDLLDPFVAGDCSPDELLDMVQNMRKSQIRAANQVRNEPKCNKESRKGDTGSTAVTLPITGQTGEVVEPMNSLTRRGTETCFDNGDVVTGWLLEWFSPFNELTDTQRDIVAGYETIRKVPSGICLFKDGLDDGTCIYLVEGTLALTATDGETIWIQGGTRHSRLPISPLTPHAHNVTAVSDVSIVVFNYTLIEKISAITRTYTSIDRSGFSESSTEAISNRVQAMYLSHVE